METLQIEIVDKKAKRLIKELANLRLINIRKPHPIKSFELLLSKLRSSDSTPSLEEITKEVELVRKKRYAKKG
jgi:hypothetical protein